MNDRTSEQILRDWREVMQPPIYMSNTSPFYDRLDQVISALEASLEQNDASPVNEESFMDDLKQAVSYGQTVRHSFDLECFRGKGTRKALHVIIYRTDSGRYELTHYYL